MEDPSPMIVGMGDDDKPFACHEPNCGMRFANEDHLSVHRMKHEMSLALNPLPGRASTNLLFVADQTPTPTKFLKNCEEIGLFSELNKNPFEEAFKKAAENQHELKHESLVALATSAENDALHTPTPPLHLSLAQHKESPLARRVPPAMRLPAVLSPIKTKDPDLTPFPGPSCDTGSTISSLASPSSDSLDGQIQTITPVSKTTSFALPPKKAMLALRDQQLKQKQKSEEVKLESPSEKLPVPQLGVNNLLTASVAMTTNAVLPTVSRVVTTTTNMSSTVASQPVSSVPPVVIQSPAVQQSSTNPKQCYLQVLVQMPDGNMVPVKIPAATVTDSVTTTTSTPAAVATTAVVNASNSTSLTSSYTKQKLKASLQQQSVARSETTVKVPIKITSPSGSIELVRQTSYSSLSDLVSPSSSSVVTEMADTSTPFKKSRMSSPDTEDDKRKKFLERNRAAAARCRLKKKEWIVNLEGKAEEMQAVNSKLQNEITALRSEVAQLKSLLLAHTDCPVTVQQREAGQLQLQGVSMETQSSSISSTIPGTVVTVTPSSPENGPAVVAEPVTLATKSTMEGATFAPFIISMPPQT